MKPNPTGTHEQDYNHFPDLQNWQSLNNTAVSHCGHNASRERWNMRMTVQDRTLSTKEIQKIWSLWGDWVKEACLTLKRSERQLHLPEILRDWWKSYFKSVVPTVSSYLLQLENKTWEKKFKYKQWSIPPRQTVWEALKNPPHNIVLLKPIQNS